MFGFNKKAFFARLTILSSINFLNAIPFSTTPLECVSMTNQECKVRPEIVNVNGDVYGDVTMYFILLVLKQVNPLVVVTISMIHMQKICFLMV